ncbi:MAG: hypothetical protein HYS53_00395, partial [Candidatus Aenigmarchaeota archaeon]|nr:hypothetical protein [Candidatus Aenigmarchaeota archaeon]
NRVLGFLRGAGYLEKDSNRLTESGRIKVEKPVGEFGNYRRDTVEQYFSWFGAGAQTVPGFEIAKSGENKIRVEKIAAPAPQDDAPDMGGANGSQQDRRNGGKAYAAAVSSIGEVYQEFPALPDLIGGRLGLEPHVLEARQNTRPERVGEFYETIRKMPTESGYLGRGHNDFFRLAMRDRRAAEQFMSWALQQEELTSEMVYAELGKHGTAVHA